MNNAKFPLGTIVLGIASVHVPYVPLGPLTLKVTTLMLFSGSVVTVMSVN